MHFLRWLVCVLINYLVIAVVYRENSNELPRTSIVSLSIVETGERYSSNSAKLTLKEPVHINYTNVEVLYLLHLSDISPSVTCPIVSKKCQIHVFILAVWTVGVYLNIVSAFSSNVCR